MSSTVLDMFDLLIVLALGLLAGFLIPIASGSGLFSLAGLMFLGLPPQVAIATNRMGGIGLWPPVIWKYAKKKIIIWKYVLPLCLLAAIGAALGAQIVLAIPENILKFVVAVLILLVLTLTYFNRDLGVVEHAAGSKSKSIGFAGFFASNVYGGFFGSGQGMFADYFLMRFLGLTILQSKATTSISTYCMILSSLAVFLTNKIPNIEFGILLAIGMGIGGWFGAHTAIKIGNLWVRRIFLICTGSMGLVLLFQSLFLN